MTKSTTSPFKKDRLKKDLTENFSEPCSTPRSSSSIIRTVHNRENPYVLLNRQTLCDTELSLRAMGLWAYAMAKPNDWIFSVRALTKTLKEGRTAIYTTIKELIQHGYVIRLEQMLKDARGRIYHNVVQYVFFEFKPTPEEIEHQREIFKKSFRCSEISHAENVHILNNDIILSKQEEQQHTRARGAVKAKPSSLSFSRPQDKPAAPKASAAKPPEASAAELKPDKKPPPKPQADDDPSKWDLFDSRQSYFTGLGSDEIEQVRSYYEKCKKSVSRPAAWLTKCIRGGWHKDNAVVNEEKHRDLNWKKAEKLEAYFQKRKWSGCYSYLMATKQEVVLFKDGKEIQTPSYGCEPHRFDALMQEILTEAGYKIVLKEILNE